MPSSTMWTSVLQATAITTFAMVLSHHMSESTFAQISENEGFYNLTQAFNMSAPFHSAYDAPEKSSYNKGEPANGTLSLSRATSRINGAPSNSTFDPTGDMDESFYQRTLPRDVFINFVLYMLEYCWLIGLERILPARPRRREVLHEGKEKVEESEDREEEVVKKWIAQGRVRRASLNWCNTFLKWVLAMTVGKLCNHTAGHLMRGLLKLQSPKTLLGGLRRHLIFSYVASFLTIDPLVVLIAFIIIPAHRQIVFLASADLVTTAFFSTIVRAFATWAVKTDFAQEAMRNMTETKRKGGTVPGLEKYEREL